MGARVAYAKCLLESKETIDISESISQRVEVAAWQQKGIFVNF